MTKESPDTQHPRPTYEDKLPLEWQVIENKPATDELVKINSDNEEILKVIYSLDEHHIEKEDITDALAQHLTQLDTKMNFLMDMVGQLLLNSMSLPLNKEITVYSTSIVWLDQQPPAVDDYIHIKLYLKAKYPKPIILPAIVKSVIQANGQYKVSCNFEQLSGAVEECLEKLIFRHHRRIVALARKS